MSEAPETIYTSAMGKWLVDDATPRWPSDVKYRRADLPPTLEAAMQLPEVRALREAGDVMANALRGSYIVPGSAKAWDAALAPFTEAKP